MELTPVESQIAIGDILQVVVVPVPSGAGAFDVYLRPADIDLGDPVFLCSYPDDVSEDQEGLLEGSTGHVREGMYSLLAVPRGESVVDVGDEGVIGMGGPLFVEEVLEEEDGEEYGYGDGGEGASDYAAFADALDGEEDENGRELLGWSNYVAGGMDEVVTNIVIVCPDFGEEAPEGYVLVEKDLNAGNDEGLTFYLAFKRVPAYMAESVASEAITGLGVAFPDTDGDETDPYSEIITHTVSGEVGDLNGGDGKHTSFIFVTRGGAGDGLPPLADVLVIDRDMGDPLPPGYSVVPYSSTGYDADTNTGTSGHDVFLAYKRVNAPVLYPSNVISLQTYYGQYLALNEDEEHLTGPLGYGFGVSVQEAFVVGTPPAAGENGENGENGGDPAPVDGGLTLRSLASDAYICIAADSGEVFLSPTPCENGVFELLVCGGSFAFRACGSNLFLAPTPSADPVFYTPLVAITELAATGNIPEGVQLAENSFDFISKDLNRETDGDYLNLWFKRGGPRAPIVDLKVINPKASESDSEESDSDDPEAKIASASGVASVSPDDANGDDLPPTPTAAGTARGSTEVVPLSEEQIAAKRDAAVEEGDEENQETIAEFVARHQDPDVEAELTRYQEERPDAPESSWTFESANLNKGNDDGYDTYPSVLRADAAVAASSAMPIFLMDVLFDSEATPGGWIKDKTDLNEGAGGSYVYLAFARTLLPQTLMLYLQEQAKLKADEIARRIRIARLKRHAELTQVCEDLYADLDQAQEGGSQPDPLPSPGCFAAGMENAGNTCYLDSLLYAMFVHSRAFEYLLFPADELELGKEAFNPFAFEDSYENSDSDSEDGGEDPAVRKVRAIRTLQAFLRDAVIADLRSGKPLDANTMELTRFLFRWAGWEGGDHEDSILFGWDATQQDAAELLDNLLDWLGAPYISAVRRFALRGIPDPESSAVERFRTLRVSMPRKKKRKSKKKRAADPRFTIGYMLHQDLSNNPLEGFKRSPSEALQALFLEEGLTDPVTPEEVWSSVIRLQPSYILGEGSSGSLSPSVIVPPGTSLSPEDVPIGIPIVVKRFNNDLVKLMGRVKVPVEISPSVVPYLDDSLDPSQYTLRLRSAVCHTGRKLNRGHYYAYARHDLPDGSHVWLKFDDLADEKVSQVTFPGPYYKLLCRQCYILFYELTHISPDASQE